MDRHESAWAAGFFDGEGGSAKNKTRGVQARINQSDNDGVPDVLLRFQRVVGCGRLHGPVREEGRQDLYYWDATSRGDVEAVAKAIWPWLGDVKRSEFVTALGHAMSEAGAPPRNELLAWAGGLYDGEGCASLSRHRTHDGHFSPEVSVTQSGDACPQVLERLRDLVGCGRPHLRALHPGRGNPAGLSLEGGGAERCRVLAVRSRTLDRTCEARTGAHSLACSRRAGTFTAR